jgi:hypothetical protein
MASTQLTTGLFTPNDYKLSSLSLVTSTGISIDLRPIMLALNIFEDIFAPCMTGSIDVGDAGDIISNFQLHGNEYILLEVDKPTLNRPITKIFRVYKISDRKFGTASLQNYTIYFCSEESILSAQTSVSKSYKGLSISSMVNDLLVNKLKVNPNKMANGIFETTTGNFDIIIPRMQPLEAIEWLTPRAYNTNENLFFFFENRDGFNFTSYENLISKPPYSTYSRNVKVENSVEQNFNSFNHLEVIQDFDVLKAMRYGAYVSTLLYLDMVSRNFSVKTFGYNDVSPNGLLNTQSPTNGLQNRFGVDLANSFSTMMKYISNSDSDPTMNPSKVQNWMPQTSARLAQINTFKLVVVIPGDVLIKAGAVITVVMPIMAPQTKATATDPLRSGNYLVASVHHKFVQDTMQTVLELLSDSVNTSLSPPQNNLPAIQKIVSA